MTDPVLRLEDVVVRSGERTLLNVAAFTVSAGQTVALIGPNGAGKTTMLHTAALLRKPDAGAVRIGGVRAASGNAAMLRRALSVVFQEPLLFDVRVLANAAAGLRFRGRPRLEAETQARSWLARFGVHHLAERKARSLSGGEASRVALARAFATEPALLLLDEPFGALDAPTRAALLPALRDRLHETGTAAILVTHDLQEATAFADRLAVMASGTILADGSAPDVMARPPSRHVAELLGVASILPATVRELRGACVVVELLPAGPAVHVAIERAASLSLAEHVTLTMPAGAVRPLRSEDEHPAGWNRLSGVVSAVVPIPFGTRVTVATPAPIAAFAPWQPGGAPWRVGARADVTFPVNAPHVIADLDPAAS